MRLSGGGGVVEIWSLGEKEHAEPTCGCGRVRVLTCLALIRVWYLWGYREPPESRVKYMNGHSCLALNEKSTVEKIQRGNFTPAYEQISEQTDVFPRDGQMQRKGIHPQRSWPRVPWFWAGPLKMSSSDTNSRILWNVGHYCCQFNVTFLVFLSQELLEASIVQDFIVLSTAPPIFSWFSHSAL